MHSAVPIYNTLFFDHSLADSQIAKKFAITFFPGKTILEEGVLFRKFRTTFLIQPCNQFLGEFIGIISHFDPVVGIFRNSLNSYRCGKYFATISKCLHQFNFQTGTSQQWNDTDICTGILLRQIVHKSGQSKSWSFTQIIKIVAMVKESRCKL